MSFHIMPHFKKWNCRHCGSLNSILMWHVPMHLTHGSSFSPSGCDPSLESPFLFLCSLKHPVALGGFKEGLLGNKWQNNGWCNEKYMKCSLNWEINCFLVLFIPTSSPPFQQVWLFWFFFSFWKCKATLLWVWIVLFLLQMKHTYFWCFCHW